MKRRVFLGTVAAGSLRAAEVGLRVAVNQTTIESAPLFLQQTPGVAIMPVPSGRIASAQLVSGMVDAATGSETQALVNSVAQPDLRIVLTLAECRYRVVARASAGIRSVADLRGKRVAITANTSSQYFLAEMLRTVGLQEADVRMVSLEGAAMPGAMAKREIDAVAIWEPHAQNSLEILGGDAVVLKDPSVYFERFNLNTTTGVLRNPFTRGLLVRLIRGVARVSSQLQSTPRDFIPALSKAIATPERVIAAVWGQFRFPAALDTAGLLGALEAMEPWAARTGGRKSRPRQAIDSLVDDGVWREARTD